MNEFDVSRCVLNTLFERRTTANLIEPAPNAEQLTRLLMAAECAPDHGMLRPWRFFIVQGEALHELGNVFAQAVLATGGSEIAVNNAKKKALRAPMIIVVASKVVSESKYPILEQKLAVGAAIQNMQLQGEAEGLASIWRTGDFAYQQEVKAAFGVSEQDDIIGYLYIGHAGKRPKPREKPEVMSRIMSHAVEWVSVGHTQALTWNAALMSDAIPDL